MHVCEECCYGGTYSAEIACSCHRCSQKLRKSKGMQNFSVNTQYTDCNSYNLQFIVGNPQKINNLSSTLNLQLIHERILKVFNAEKSKNYGYLCVLIGKVSSRGVWQRRWHFLI
ncbi:uncharacterized protein LOC134240481 isoform X2 [Saccostrea cucullata]|uniref:uncharacterized protein LOC134240481 isoform X2 n=1 Tax=Saccostrea cuccullata TaxID=36930 RepID=UPI002ED12190